jgi:hypothetical protein
MKINHNLPLSQIVYLHAEFNRRANAIRDIARPLINEFGNGRIKIGSGNYSAGFKKLLEAINARLNSGNRETDSQGFEWWNSSAYLNYNSIEVRISVSLPNGNGYHGNLAEDSICLARASGLDNPVFNGAIPNQEFPNVTAEELEAGIKRCKELETEMRAIQDKCRFGYFGITV